MGGRVVSVFRNDHREAWVVISRTTTVGTCSCFRRSPLLAIAVEATIAFLSCWAVSKFGLWVKVVQNAPRQTVGIASIACGQEVGYF